jgi:hypothetical protein
MGINDAGHIMGTGFDSWREPCLSAGFVPEPEIYTMMLAGWHVACWRGAKAARYAICALSFSVELRA